MTDLPKCPQCGSQYTYEGHAGLACPDCGHEWTEASTGDNTDQGLVVRDANGTELHDGDTVTVIKGLKVKGHTSALKVGTKVKNIRLVDGDHDIDCKIDGFGNMALKSMYVKKS